MKVDATLQAVGRQCGIDVNAIISKYKNDVEQHSSKPEEVQSFTNKFDGDRNLVDQLQICKVCKGCCLACAQACNDVKLESSIFQF